MMKTNKEIIKYPMKMRPYYQNYLWGGQLLKTVFHKESGYAVTAESWELSTHPHGQSIIDSGIYAGERFGDWIKEHREAAGRNLPKNVEFPVLIKFLDVNTALSIQVHPSDETAIHELGENGKAEVWYIVGCKSNAFIHYGLRSELSKEELLSCFEKGTICDALNKVPVAAGQVWFITPGVLHSAGNGVLIAEVQQTSDTTFRLYDYDRIDANGKKRPLHLERACDVLCYKPVKSEDERVNNSYQTDDFVFANLFECGYFKLSKVNLQRSITLQSNEDSFHALLAIGGDGTIVYGDKIYPFENGDCYFMPALMGAYSVMGSMEFLLTRI